MLTTYFLKCITEDIFKHQETSTIPYEFYIALSSTEPTVDGTGITEPPASAGYSRVYIDNSNLIFGRTDDENVVSNHSRIYFPEAIDPWRDIAYYAIFDEAEGGNLLMYGALSKITTVPIKAIVSLPISSLKISARNEVVI